MLLDSCTEKHMLEIDFLNFMNIESKNTEKFHGLKKPLMLIAQVIKYGSNQNDSLLNIKPAAPNYSVQFLVRNMVFGEV